MFRETTDYMEPFRRLLYAFAGICIGLLAFVIIVDNYSAKPIVLDRVVVRERTPQDDGFSRGELLSALQEMNLRFSDIVYAQAVLETGWFRSRSFIKGNNLFGMKLARRRPTTAVGTYLGHAKYESWRESVLDYALFQAVYLKGCKTREQYLEYIKKNYAEDPNYVEKIKAIAAKVG